MTVQIDFEEGFANDTVTVSSGGEELWRGEMVTTNLSSNVAAVAHIEVEDGANLEIAVPTRKLSTSTPAQAPFVRVEIDAGELRIVSSRERPLHL